MSATPAVQYVFAVAVALLSAAPVVARESGTAAPHVWAPPSAEQVLVPSEEVDDGRGGLVPGVAASICNAEINGDGVTDFASVDASALRQALAAVAAGGTVKVAGYCSGAVLQNGSTQVALITKTITLAGGYTTTNWTTYNPAGNPTTMDALGGGRVISAPVAVTLRGFTAKGGYISSAVVAYGGGIMAANALTLSEMIISGNTLTGTGILLTGGGVSVGAAANVANSIFSNNAAGGGGGLFSNAALTLNGGLFQNNAAVTSGGGLLAYSTLALTDTQFLSNTARYRSAGGAYVFGAATLTGGLFQNNAAAEGGGGMVALGELALSGTKFLANTAAYGGALHLNFFSGASAKQAVNALFARNTATTRGAAIYVSNGAPFSLIHATIASPTLPAGATQAIYVDAGTVYLTNTLIATHTIGIGVADGTVGDWNTLFAGVSTPYTGTVASAGGITGTAGFVSPAADDYHLGAGSAAINAGINAGVYVDFDGQARPQGGGFDIGYDEYFFGTRAYLPIVRR